MVNADRHVREEGGEVSWEPQGERPVRGWRAGSSAPAHFAADRPKAFSRLLSETVRCVWAERGDGTNRRGLLTTERLREIASREIRVSKAVGRGRKRP